VVEVLEHDAPALPHWAAKRLRRLVMVTIALTVAVLVLIGAIIYLEVRGPTSSYVDGYNFAVAFRHGEGEPHWGPINVRNADASCSVWSFSNAGGVPKGDVPRAWRRGCKAALEAGAFNTIAR
jgi:hypothetical protein